MKTLEGPPIISADEMMRIEKEALATGLTALDFMDCAGKNIAAYVAWFVHAKHLEKTATLLTGKGNNAGDAYTAGIYLLQKGWRVVSQQLYPIEKCSSLCRNQMLRFQDCGGKIDWISNTKHIEIPTTGIIIDGITGTGFQDKASGIMLQAIEAANRATLPILAIDIPSGLNGNTGIVESSAIKAHTTLYLEAPKIGFFIEHGWNYVGNLTQIEFGLPKKLLDQTISAGNLLDHRNLSLPEIERTRHKYQAGYVLGLASSRSMPGAGILAALAALRSGAGIVRLFSCMKAFFPSDALEIIHSSFSKKEWRMQQERASSGFIGPGIGRDSKAKKLFHQALHSFQKPLVIDADGLFFLSQLQSYLLPQNSVLTPHKQEMQRLLNSNSVTWEPCRSFAEHIKATVILKGAPTVIFHPDKKPIVITRGDPGMATAGSGDVLTGMVAAMLAQGKPAYEAAALAVYLHGLAGERAAELHTSYGVIASDIIQALPYAFSQPLKSFVPIDKAANTGC